MDDPPRTVTPLPIHAPSAIVTGRGALAVNPGSLQIFVAMIEVRDVNVVAGPYVIADDESQHTDDAHSLSDDAPIADRHDRSVVENVSWAESGGQCESRSGEKVPLPIEMYSRRTISSAQTRWRSRIRNRELPGVTTIWARSVRREEIVGAQQR